MPLSPLPSPLIVVTGAEAAGRDDLARLLGHRLSAPLCDIDAVVQGRPELSSCAGVVTAMPLETGAAELLQRLREAGGETEIVIVHLSGEEQPADANARLHGARTRVICVDAELTAAQQLARVLPHLGVRSRLDPDAPVFSMGFDAVLFDLDGTLIDSTASVLRSWRRFATLYGVSMATVAENHGQPARALISRLLAPSQHEEGLERITQIEVSDAEGLLPILGAQEFFESIPPDRRAIVTSGSLAIASARLKAAGFETPSVFVTADDVRHGKPDPEPFLLAAERIGVDPGRCLVVEDAPAGIGSARAAGCAVIALSGTVPVDELKGADLVVDGLDRLAPIQAVDGELVLRVAV